MTISERARFALSLTATGLACERGGRMVFAGLSFTALPGTLTEIVGPNGAGKSSLLRLVAGLVPPAQGQLSHMIDGRPAGPDDPPLPERLHLLGHQDGFKAAMTPAESLSFAAALLGAGPPDRPALLGEVGLARLADLPVQVLSAGQRRRLGLARLLAAPRPLWLLDEPFAAVDDAGRALVRRLISAHLAAGGTVLAATHDPLLPGAARVVLEGAA